MMGLTEWGKYLEVGCPGEASEVVTEAIKILRWKLRTEHLPSFLRGSKYSAMHHSESHQLIYPVPPDPNPVVAPSDQTVEQGFDDFVPSWTNTPHTFTVRFIPFDRPGAVKLNALPSLETSNRDIYLAIYLDNHGYALHRARRHEEACGAFGESLFLRQKHFAQIMSAGKRNRKPPVSQRELDTLE